MDTPLLLDLDRLGASYVLLMSFVGLALLGGLLFRVGAVGWLVNLAGVAARRGIQAGFRLWQRHLAWADWPLFGGLVATLLAAGIAVGGSFPALPLVCGLVLLFLGVITCLAYVFIDLERYDVARGYKAIHNPLPGQELAVNLVHHGDQVGLPLLAAAGLGVVGGFAMLNQALYDTIGASWYRLGEEGGQPGYADFLAYTLINLLGVVDLLHLASSYNYVHASVVRQAEWPAATLLSLFKSFFTLVLLQQIFASVRRGRVLSETIADFWSPHPPIHERARGALPIHGPGVVQPLLRSLYSVTVLTDEQRRYLPRIIADVGPAAIAVLTRQLHDSNARVRAIAVAALGHLHALDRVPQMVALLQDADEGVRQSLVEALGVIGGPGARAARRRRLLRRVLAKSRGWLWRTLHRGQPLPALPADPLELTVATLRSALADSSAEVRTQAARSLGQLGPAAAPAVPDLIGQLRGDGEAFRCQAAEALGQVGSASPEAVAALVGLLAETAAPIRAAAVRALGAMKQAAAAAVPSLTPLLQDGDQAVRADVADALGSIGNLQPAAIEELTRGLDSCDTLVRAQTAEALGSIGASAADAAPALAEALADSNDRVRAKAAQALGQMGEAAAQAVPQLMRALHDADTWVSAVAAEALGEIGDGAADAVPALVRSLGHANLQVRANAAGALGKMGGMARDAAPALLTAAQDAQDEVRVQAIAALGEVGPSDAAVAQALRTAVDDVNPRVRAAAVEALGKKNDLDGDATDALLRATADANDEVRARAAQALIRVAGASDPVLSALCALLQDDSVAVQTEAAQALSRLGTPAVSAGPFLVRLAQSGVDAVREQALRAIALIQPPEALEAFMAAMRDAQPEVRMVASAGLIKVAEVSQATVPALVEALSDPEARVRANVALILSRLNVLPQDALAPLTGCAGDPDDGVRFNAALALRLAVPGAGAAVFRHLLADPTSRLRLLAAGTLLRADVTDTEAAAALPGLLDEPSPRIRRAAIQLIDSLDLGGLAFLGALRQRTEVEVDPVTSDLLAKVIARLERRSAATATPLDVLGAAAG